MNLPKLGEKSKLNIKIINQKEVRKKRKKNIGQNKWRA